MKVLVVDDEAPIREAVAYSLRREGFEPLTAEDAPQCLAALEKEQPGLLILDIMLPSASGYDICRQVRARSDLPIIMLTARAAEMDRVLGLEIGADDYVTKPFSMRELMARVKTVLRRRQNRLHEQQEPLHARGQVVIDVTRHEVSVRGRPVALTPREFDLLRFLAENPGRAFTRQALLDRVWGADAYVGEKTIDVHIRWLREKIEEDAANPCLLLTVRGVGYKFADPEEA